MKIDYYLLVIWRANDLTTMVFNTKKEIDDKASELLKLKEPIRVEKHACISGQWTDELSDIVNEEALKAIDI
jgi:hypothetical protein